MATIRKYNDAGDERVYNDAGDFRITTDADEPEPVVLTRWSLVRGRGSRTTVNAGILSDLAQLRG